MSPTVAPPFGRRDIGRSGLTQPLRSTAASSASLMLLCSFGSAFTVTRLFPITSTIVSESNYALKVKMERVQYGWRLSALKHPLHASDVMRNIYSKNRVLCMNAIQRQRKRAGSFDPARFHARSLAIVRRRRAMSRFLPAWVCPVAFSSATRRTYSSWRVFLSSMTITPSSKVQPVLVSLARASIRIGLMGYRFGSAFTVTRLFPMSNTIPCGFRHTLKENIR